MVFSLIKEAYIDNIVIVMRLNKIYSEIDSLADGSH